MKKLSKEWLVLILIAILVIEIGVLEWKKTAVKTPQGWQAESRDSPGVEKQGKTTTRLEKEENSVTVIIEYLPNQSQSSLIFRTALDTHSVDLDSFDFTKDITLEKDGKSVSPSLVKQEGSDHHRSAEINFPQTSLPFTIVFKNLSNVPRREFNFEKL